MAICLGRRSTRPTSWYEMRFHFGGWCMGDGAECLGRLHLAVGRMKAKYCVGQISGE